MKAPSATGAVELVDSETLQMVRENIYLGPGYHVFRNWIPGDRVQYLLDFWNRAGNTSIDRYNKQEDLRPGCPDVSLRKPDLDRHFNYFWNKPADPYSYTVAWQLQALRNAIEGRPAGSEYLPLTRKYRRDPERLVAASYRMVFTRRGGEVKEHADWTLDHSRVQLTLLLSDYGVDYEGGFFLADALWSDNLRNLCQEERLRAGDLLVFRYAQRHAVRDVEQAPGGKGFCRMLMPLDTHPAGDGPIKPFDPDKRRDYDDTPYQDSKNRYYSERIQPLMNLAIKERFDPSEVYFYRGLWGRYEVFEDWQVDACFRHGLRPEHNFLDIGCGLLRLGMALVNELEDGRYHGIDPVPGYIQLGERYMREVVRSDRQFHLLCDANFRFDRFTVNFDFAMAHSVFTHLSFQDIARCFAALKDVMNPGGKFLFTIVLGKESREDPIVYADGIPMIKSRHGSMDFYDEIASTHGISIQHIGRDNHPTQSVCVATF